MFSFTVFHPGYGNTVTVDSHAEQPTVALRSIRLFLQRQNRPLREAARRLGRPARAGVTLVRLPSRVDQLHRHVSGGIA